MTFYHVLFVQVLKTFARINILNKMLGIHRRDSSQSGFSYTSSALLSANYSASTECYAILLIGGRAQKHCQTDIVTKMKIKSENG